MWGPVRCSEGHERYGSGAVVCCGDATIETELRCDESTSEYRAQQFYLGRRRVASSICMHCGGRRRNAKCAPAHLLDWSSR